MMGDASQEATFRDASGLPRPEEPRSWKPLLIPRERIEEEIARLSCLAVPAGGRRAADIIHPQATEPGLGVAPGLGISINVLRPGESVVLPRDNANRVEFAIGGTGHALIGEQKLPIARWSVWTCPTMIRRQYRNDGDDVMAWLSYSNVPVLEKLGIHYSDAAESRPPFTSVNGVSGEVRFRRSTAPDHAILEDGARFRGYEFLTDIEVVENKALVWPFAETEPYLTTVEGDGKRTIMLLYNPATGRRNGTTHSFFATLASWAPGVERLPPARGHKHTSTACNYHFRGSGMSIVDGQRYDWRAGDLMLSAPAWSEHAHGAGEEGSTVLTIQDHPFQIGMESLIWQEKMDGPILTLGAEAGQTGYVGPRLEGVD
ncbi:hypothetical protein [Sphingomonas profundi]|uniref:hypothetical protein n=1 Tax=Alterirhizorhabdus profundi TaxID=2681549 RepID=UPI0018D0EB0E|nr:hypothetical protein [Sphingomonas profundi]